jgi:hypothetical protein
MGLSSTILRAAEAEPRRPGGVSGPWRAASAHSGRNVTGEKMAPQATPAQCPTVLAGWLMVHDGVV